MKSPKAPAASAPISERAIEIYSAGRQRQIDLLRRKGMDATIVAGNPDRSGAKLLSGLS